VAAYVPFSWWVLGLLIAGALVLGLILRLREDILEVPISAMLIFSVDSHAAATSRITETLVGAAAGLAAGLIFAPLRVQPAKDAVGELSRQMADLLGRMADGLAEAPDPKRATEWLDRTRELRGEIERMDEALGQAEESVRLNPRRIRSGDPAAGLRDGVDTLERAAIDMRVLARSVADSARIDSEHTPVREAETRARLAAVLAELSAAVRAYGQLLEAEPASGEQDGHAGRGGVAAEPLTEVLADHLEEARRQQDRLAADVPAQLLAVRDVIPDEQSVPAGVLGPPGKIGHDGRVGEVAEVRNVDREAHVLMLARRTGRFRSPCYPARHSGWPQRVANYPGGRIEIAQSAVPA
jgi:gas vesicle protein